MKFLILIVLLSCLIFILFTIQHKLIYFPRQYVTPKPDAVEEIGYSTGQGSQTAYFLRPKVSTGGKLGNLWLLFGGNGSLALNWYSFAFGYPDPGAGFLLVEYPGYGKCEGKASPAAILESTEKAVDSLADHLDISRDRLEISLNILGHSLGAAAALQFAPLHPVKKVVLLAPFTSLPDMARVVVGWPLNNLTTHRFDNRARLMDLFRNNPETEVTIFHGDQDEVVPVKMGRELSERHVGHIVYTEIQNGDHNSIMDTAEKEIYQVMLAGDAEEKAVAP